MCVCLCKGKDFGVLNDRDGFKQERITCLRLEDREGSGADSDSVYM